MFSLNIMNFPQYRKRFDNKAFYKVTSFKAFEEIQLIGKRFFFLNVHADKYFEKLRVQELLEVDNNLYTECSKEEFNKIEQLANEYLSRKK